MTTTTTTNGGGGDSCTLDSGVDSGADSAWNFEISVWDESCLKELNNNNNSTANNSKSNSTASQSVKSSKTNSMFSFVANLPADFLKATPKSDSSGTGSGWNDFGNSKTLFFDPNDMDLLADEFIDSEDEVEFQSNSNYNNRIFLHFYGTNLSFK